MTELVRYRPGRQSRLSEIVARVFRKTCDVTHVKPAASLASRKSRDVLLGSRQPPSVSGNTGAWGAAAGRRRSMWTAEGGRSTSTVPGVEIHVGPGDRRRASPAPTVTDKRDMDPGSAFQQSSESHCTDGGPGNNKIQSDQASADHHQQATEENQGGTQYREPQSRRTIPIKHQRSSVQVIGLFTVEGARPVDVDGWLGGGRSLPRVKVAIRLIQEASGLTPWPASAAPT